MPQSGSGWHYFVPCPEMDLSWHPIIDGECPCVDLPLEVEQHWNEVSRQWYAKEGEMRAWESQYARNRENMKQYDESRQRWMGARP